MVVLPRHWWKPAIQRWCRALLYLHADGSVCRESELRADAAINGKLRPLYFSSNRLDDALAAYFRERLAGGHGLGGPDVYRGLDPGS